MVLIDRTFLLKNKRAYVMFAALCVFGFVLVYLLFSVISSFVSVDEGKVASETQTYLTELQQSITFPEDVLQSFREDGVIRREGIACEGRDQGDRFTIGCPILIPGSNHYGNKENPFEPSY